MRCAFFPAAALFLLGLLLPHAARAADAPDPRVIADVEGYLAVLAVAGQELDVNDAVACRIGAALPVPLDTRIAWAILAVQENASANPAGLRELAQKKLAEDVKLCERLSGDAALLDKLIAACAKQYASGQGHEVLLTGQMDGELALRLAKTEAAVQAAVTPAIAAARARRHAAIAQALSRNPAAAQAIAKYQVPPLLAQQRQEAMERLAAARVKLDAGIAPEAALPALDAEGAARIAALVDASLTQQSFSLGRPDRFAAQRLATITDLPPEVRVARSIALSHAGDSPEMRRAIAVALEFEKLSAQYLIQCPAYADAALESLALLYRDSRYRADRAEVLANYAVTDASAAKLREITGVIDDLTPPELRLLRAQRRAALEKAVGRKPQYAQQLLQARPSHAEVENSRAQARALLIKARPEVNRAFHPRQPGEPAAIPPATLKLADFLSDYFTILHHYSVNMPDSNFARLAAAGQLPLDLRIARAQCLIHTKPITEPKVVEDILAATLNMERFTCGLYVDQPDLAENIIRMVDGWHGPAAAKADAEELKYNSAMTAEQARLIVAMGRLVTKATTADVRAARAMRRQFIIALLLQKPDLSRNLAADTPRAEVLQSREKVRALLEAAGKE